MVIAAKNKTFIDQTISFEVLQLPDQLPTSLAQLESIMNAQRERDHAVVHQLVSNAVNAATVHIREQERARADVIAQATVQSFLEQMMLARKRMFGASSEQLNAQSRLFDEAEVLAAQPNVEPSEDNDDETTALTPPLVQDQSGSATGKQTSKKARGKRAVLAPHLLRVPVVHDLPEAQRLCPCGTPMVQIGQEISEQLDIVPMTVRVLQHIRILYGCPDSSHAPKLAPLPPQPLPKSNASPDLLAMLLAVKFVDGLPLARFEYVLQRHGAAIPRNTLARWVIAVAHLLQPLFNLARDAMHESAVIHMDETVVQVLKAPKHLPDKAPTSNSYIWVQTGGPPGKPVTLYDYDPSRSGQVPQRLLADWQGHLMTDGYEGYQAISQHEGVEHLVCWAHARRKFVEAMSVQPKGKRGLANEAIEFIAQLYAVEKIHKTSTNVLRQKARQEHSVPVLKQLHDWMLATQPLIPPKTTLGKALAYLAKYWDRLNRYTELGDLPIDNNPCENAIRPFVIGRKAWLFSDTPAGANASAIIYSLIQTCKANGQEPYLWLRHVLRDLPSAKTADDYDALMPWNLKLLPNADLKF
jgi:transposase